jgi:protein involved in polysaccharide export with SLBB domain
MKVLALFAACLALAAPCGAFAQPSAPTSLTAPSVAPVDTSYRLGAGDEIRINVYGEPDLAVEQQLGPNGDISAPLIGDVQAGGMTVADLSSLLETRYQEGFFLVNPQVSVTILNFRPFYVVGEVEKPGAYPYAANLTATSAIAFAGGFNRRANRQRIYIKRAGQTEETQFAADAPLALQPGDTVRVGEGVLSSLSDIPFGWLLRF